MDWRRWPASVKAYVAAVVGVGVPVYGWALYHSIATAVTYPADKLVSLLGILVVAGLSARWVVRIPRTTNWIAVADCLVISIVMIFGLAPGIVAHGFFHAVSYWYAVEREPQEHLGVQLIWSRLRALFNLSLGAIHALAYGTVFLALKPSEPITAPEIVVPVLLLGLTYFFSNALGI
ncbi:MAG TPA: hypothetical protein VFF86_03040, partial [Candidatus Methylomirabilis sp.]|nr:hypothetical protein [Candidatus Methylomirabilis sp.]